MSKAPSKSPPPGKGRGPVKNAAATENRGDYELITPAHNLRDFARKTTEPAPPDLVDLEAIARAEEAMAALAVEFDDWMAREVARLVEQTDIVKKEGLHMGNRPALFRVAHDLKGEASTFGYPLAGAIADSLCLLLEEVDNPTLVPVDLLEKHTIAIAAILREGAKGDNDPTGKALAQSLISITRETVEKILGVPLTR